MLSSPYPVPPLRAWQAAMVTGWAAGVAAGTWVLTYPPVSYEGIGLALTTMWGLMLVIGSGLCTLAHALQRYKLELPGLVLALGGVVIYGYLSWEQTVGTSPGSGPRALLLLLLACWIVARVRVLIYLDRQARRLKELQEGDA